MTETTPSSIHQQLAFTDDGELEPTSESVETSLADFGADVDTREPRPDQPTASSIFCDDRPLDYAEDDGQQETLYPDVDDDQQALDGSQASTISTFSTAESDETSPGPRYGQALAQTVDVHCVDTALRAVDGIGEQTTSEVWTSSTTVRVFNRSYLRDTSVSQYMSTDSDAGGDGEMEKINVRVPQSLLAKVDEVWEERGYTNKSEFIRDVLRDAVAPPTQLSEEALEHLAESREQREQGETVSQDEVKDQLGIDD